MSKELNTTLTPTDPNEVSVSFVLNHPSLPPEYLEEGAKRALHLSRISGSIELPTCPSCGAFCPTIVGNPQMRLIFDCGNWIKREEEATVYQCLECTEELDASDLDRLGVPNDLR